MTLCKARQSCDRQGSSSLGRKASFFLLCVAKNSLGNVKGGLFAGREGGGKREVKFGSLCAATRPGGLRGKKREAAAEGAEALEKKVGELADLDVALDKGAKPATIENNQLHKPTEGKPAERQRKKQLRKAKLGERAAGRHEGVEVLGALVRPQVSHAPWLLVVALGMCRHPQLG